MTLLNQVFLLMSKQIKQPEKAMDAAILLVKHIKRSPSDSKLTMYFGGDEKYGNIH